MLGDPMTVTESRANFWRTDNFCRPRLSESVGLGSVSAVRRSAVGVRLEVADGLIPTADRRTPNAERRAPSPEP